ncbi:hypothetical protein NECAME_11146 [Necator americanus]|uniref:Uncharacterized protein n=1 Tax=Necator americanus TaxID=51031 RepID=W2T5Z7_NECAM|nr:hypothetical protein NECAME_11146 [Necator americanus]ETN77293.1 hypothetical protein NECAME_11146 [Necator americanus]
MSKCGKKTKPKPQVDDSSVDWSSQLALLRMATIIVAGTYADLLTLSFCGCVMEWKEYTSKRECVARVAVARASVDDSAIIDTREFRMKKEMRRKNKER